MKNKTPIGTVVSAGGSRPLPIGIPATLKKPMPTPVAPVMGPVMGFMKPGKKKKL